MLGMFIIAAFRECGLERAAIFLPGVSAVMKRKTGSEERPLLTVAVLIARSLRVGVLL
jgi:hypothetical protein